MLGPLAPQERDPTPRRGQHQEAPGQGPTALLTVTAPDSPWLAWGPELAAVGKVSRMQCSWADGLLTREPSLQGPLRVLDWEARVLVGTETSPFAPFPDKTRSRPRALDQRAARPLQGRVHIETGVPGRAGCGAGNCSRRETLACSGLLQTLCTGVWRHRARLAPTSCLPMGAHRAGGTYLGHEPTQRPAVN